MEYIHWIFRWKCMIECDGKWDVEIYLFIMEIGVGNPIENEIPWPFFMCKYCNLIENRIERLNFFNENAW